MRISDAFLGWLRPRPCFAAQQAVAAVPEPEAAAMLPFDRAYLCADCSAVVGSSNGCPNCGSTAVLSLQRVVEGAPRRRESGATRQLARELIAAYRVQHPVAEVAR